MQFRVAWFTYIAELTALTLFAVFSQLLNIHLMYNSIGPVILSFVSGYTIRLEHYREVVNIDSHRDHVNEQYTQPAVRIPFFSRVDIHVSDLPR